ncbi:hypothetical protein MAP00_003252 [Monascus purpureus]|nr:hypothetical protein MAP00_003252 [Monascus purpureus]
MLRFRRLLQSSPLFLRLGPRSFQRAEVVNVRHVKFKRPWIRKILDDDDYDVDHLESSHGGNGIGSDNDKGHKKHAHRAETMNGEDTFFIPLGWPRLRKGDFYALSDPEWQQFVKISQDSRKLELLRDELAAIVLQSASQSTQISHMLGNPLTLTGSWLVHHFPSRAPPAYERSGLAISDTGISWVTKPISPEDGDRLLRFMQPFSMALAIQDAYSVFLKRQLHRLRNFAKLNGTRPSNHLTSVPDSERSPPGPNLNELSQIVQSNPRKSEPSEKRESSHSLVISSLRRLPLPELGPGSDLHEASVAFKRRLKDSWSKNTPTSRRGTFYVAGPVGIKGPKGFCRVEVRGEYDPDTANWLAVSMQLKDLNLFSQRALGRQ